MNKTKWDKLPIMCWSLTLYKEDDKGNQKFYEYTGDHSFVSEGMENEYLSEIDGEDAWLTISSKQKTKKKQ